MDQPNASALAKILDQLPSSTRPKIIQPEEHLAKLVDKYPDIEVSALEIWEAVQQLKHKKDYAQKMAKKTAITQNWNAEEYYHRALERLNGAMNAKGQNKEYVLKEGENYEILGFFCYYFANNQKDLSAYCETNNFFLITPPDKISVNKGIMLIGSTGKSKTMLFKAFAQNPRSSYVFVEAKHIRNEYKNKELGQKTMGLDVIRHFSSDFNGTGKSFYNQPTYDLCIDDLDAEDPVKLYGEDVEVLVDVLMNRLNDNLITHINSNADLQEIENRYGSRVMSRMYEQMNILFMPAEMPDYRKI